MVVLELLASPLSIDTVFVAASAAPADAGAVRSAAESRGVRVLTVTDRVAGSLSATTTPQGIVATATIPPSPRLPRGDEFVLVLAGVADPGNAGTLVRTAWAAGAGAVVFTHGSVDPFGPKTVRAAAGALFGLPVVRDAAPDALAAELRALGYRLIGTEARGGVPLYGSALTGAVAVVLGNEAWGLPPGLGLDVDTTVTIPMPGPAESLNVASAGAVVLFEVARQRAGAVSRVSSTASPGGGTAAKEPGGKG